MADRAQELANYYGSLEMHKNLPSKGKPEWDNSSELKDILMDYLLSELHLHEALISVKLERNLADQISDLEDALVKKTFEATFMPYLSLSQADMYLFAQDGGLIRTSLIHAANSYTEAGKSIYFAGQMAKAAVKALEIRLRELGDGAYFLRGIPTEDLIGAPLDEFKYPR